MPIPCTPTAAGIAFWIHVSPGAKRASVGGVHGDALRVAVQAQAIEGRANAACVDALAAAFAVRRAALSLDPGARGRRKRVAIAGDPAALAAQLGALAGDS
jgi:uncharacterized protein (TIGR00251 family)